MPRCVIYEDDGSVYSDWTAEMVIACGFSKPGHVHATRNCEISGTSGENFACKLHLSAQLQVEARELLRSAVKQLPGNQTELPEDLERDYIDVILNLERRMLEDEVQHAES